MTKCVIAILNQKGGVGKTTTTVNVGAYLAKSGSRVLLIDLDPQGNASSGLGIDKQNLGDTLYDVLLGSVSGKSILIKTSIEGLEILPSNSKLAAAEIDMVNIPNREFLLNQALQSFDHDYIIIDCPPSLGLLSLNGLAAADQVIIPVQAEYYALEGLGQLLGVIQRVQQGINPDLDLLGVVLTMYDKRNALSEQVYSEIKKHFSDKVFKTIIPRNVRLAEAPSFGKTIMEHDGWSKGARAYKELAKEVARRVKH